MTAEPADCFYESHGLRLHYVDWGNAAAPPLILVHGGLDHCRNWDAIARELQPHFHVVALDLRGHGDSEWARGSSYSLADHVYDLARLVRFAGLQDAAIVGHSMGGRVAAHLAAGGGVGGIIALAPWWPRDDADLVPTGCRMLVMHGTADTWTDPGSSSAQTRRAALRGVDAQWVPVPGAGHYMIRRWSHWHRRPAAYIADHFARTQRDT